MNTEMMKACENLTDAWIKKYESKPFWDAHTVLVDLEVEMNEHDEHSVVYQYLDRAYDKIEDMHYDKQALHEEGICPDCWRRYEMGREELCAEQGHYEVTYTCPCSS